MFGNDPNADNDLRAENLRLRRELEEARSLLQQQSPAQGALWSPGQGPSPANNRATVGRGSVNSTPPPPRDSVIRQLSYLSPKFVVDGLERLRNITEASSLLFMDIPMIEDDHSSNSSAAQEHSYLVIHRQEEEMIRQMNDIQCSIGIGRQEPDSPEMGLFATATSLAQQAVKSWRSISGAELTFVPTPTKGEQVEQPIPSSSIHNVSFEEAMEQVYVALAGEPPDIASATMMAMRMVEIVGESQADDAEAAIQLELAEASTRKVTAQALSSIRSQIEAARALKRWRECLRETAALAQAAVRLGASEEAAALIVTMATEGVRADSDEWLLWVRCKEEFDAKAIVTAAAEVLRGAVEFVSLAEESLGRKGARAGPDGAAGGGGAVEAVAQEAGKTLAMLLTKLLDSDNCVWARAAAGGGGGDGGGAEEAEAAAALEQLRRLFECLEAAQARLDDGLLGEELSEILSGLLEMHDALAAHVLPQ